MIDSDILMQRVRGIIAGLKREMEHKMGDIGEEIDAYGFELNWPFMNYIDNYLSIDEWLL
jgi:hypothetical protein